MVSPVRVALLFPGQGSQVVGMGKRLCETYPEAADVFQKANDALGMDLRKLCFEGPEKELTRTQNNQPALLATSIACWEVFKKQGIAVEVAGCGGLSLGEYTALVVAGAISLEDALKLVRARGQFMQEASDLVPSTMASIMGLDIEHVRMLCQSVAGNGSRWVLDIANVNCPGQIVLSGHRQAIAAACEKVGAMDGARAIVLNVSGAFHSRLMQPAADKFRAVLDKFNFSTPTVPVFSNVTGQKIEAGGAIRDLLVKQITSPVLWEQCVRTMLGLKPDLFIEMGSGKVLSGLLRKIDRTAKSCTIEDPEGMLKTVETCKAGGSPS